MGFWASIRGEPFLRLRDETFANCKDATVHQDPKRWACGRCSETSSFFFCLRDETCANCRDADCTPGSQALGLRASFDGEPFLCLNRETYLHRTGACGTMLHHLRTRASHLMYCTGTALVGPCCTICAREHATYTAARVCGTMLRRGSKPHY